MEINSLIDGFTSCIQTDSTIDAWAELEYSQAVQVFENMDLREPPGKESCPLVAVFAHGKQGGGREKTAGIGFLCLVHDSETPENIQGVIRFTGGRNVETLRQMVVDAIKQHVPAGCEIDSIETDYDQIDQFPYVSASMLVTLTETWTIGSDPFE